MQTQAQSMHSVDVPDSNGEDANYMKPDTTNPCGVRQCQTSRSHASFGFIDNRLGDRRGAMMMMMLMITIMIMIMVGMQLNLQ